MVMEGDDPIRFGNIGEDPEFQVLGQELAALMNFEPFRPDEFWTEVFSWAPAEPGPDRGTDS